MFKRAFLILLTMLSIGMLPQYQPNGAEAQNPETILGFHVMFEDGREPYEGDVIWLLDGEGIPVALRTSMNGEILVEVGYYGNFTESFPTPEFWFYDVELGAASSARIEPDGLFMVAPYGDWNQAYHTETLRTNDWNGSVILVQPHYMPKPTQHPMQACWHWQGHYAGGAYARSFAVPFQDASGNLYTASIIAGNEFAIAPNGNWSQAHTAPDLTYFDPNVGADVTVHGPAFVNGSPQSLTMVDWNGSTFDASLISCNNYPFPLYQPHRSGGW